MSFPPLSTFRAQGDYVSPLTFARLDVRVELGDDGSATFNLSAVLRNDGEVPVVPGYVVFRLSREGGNLTVRDPWGRDLTRNSSIEVVAIPQGDGIAVRCSMWQPLRPGDEERFEVGFSVPEVVSRGILFDEASLEIGPLSSGVEEGTLRLIPPDGKRITYADPLPSGPGSSWSLSGMGPDGTVNLRIEVSWIPLPTLPVPGYLVFWGSAAAAVVAVGLYARGKSGGRRTRRRG